MLVWWCAAKGRGNEACIFPDRPRPLCGNIFWNVRRVKSEFVFLSYLEDGLSTTAIHKRLMRYREEANIQISAHRLRHSFANELLNADAPITSI